MVNTDQNKQTSKTITLEMLSTAIQNGVKTENRRMSYEESLLTAQHILNFFGFQNRIIDNSLEPDDRDVFYFMEDIGILTTDREETTLYDGREWRIHYWILNYYKVLELQSEKRVEMEERLEEDIYREIPDFYWTRGEQ